MAPPDQYLPTTHSLAPSPAKQAVRAVLAWPLLARAALPKKSPSDDPHASRVRPISEEGRLARLASNDRMPTTCSHEVGGRGGVRRVKVAGEKGIRKEG